MKTKKEINWIKEAEAAEIFGVKPMTLRKRVKEGKWPIRYNKIGTYKYDLDEINKFLMETLTEVDIHF